MIHPSHLLATARIACIVGLVGFASLTATVATAAEIRLRSRCEVADRIVLLGDVADIYSVTAEESAGLAAVELFPAPPNGKSRYVTLREIHDALVLRGINLSQHTISGASRIALVPAELPPRIELKAPPAAAPVRVNQRQLIERLHDAIADHLAAQAGADFAHSCRIDIRLSEAIAREIAASGGALIAATGGSAPWLGTQRFTIANSTTSQPTWEVVAEITQSPQLVVAKRPLARGTILGPLDVELVAREETTRIATPLRDLEAVLGRELLQTVAAGQALSSEQIRAPILVRRGDPVTVYARAAGLQVRVTARAQDEGSLGDMITVESFNDRRRFLARVCGLQEVEILVGPTATAATSTVVSRNAPGSQHTPDSRSSVQ